MGDEVCAAVAAVIEALDFLPEPQNDEKLVVSVEVEMVRDADEVALEEWVEVLLDGTEGTGVDVSVATSRRPNQSRFQIEKRRLAIRITPAEGDR